MLVTLTPSWTRIHPSSAPTPEDADRGRRGGRDTAGWAKPPSALAERRRRRAYRGEHGGHASADARRCSETSLRPPYGLADEATVNDYDRRPAIVLPISGRRSAVHATSTSGRCRSSNTPLRSAAAPRVSLRITCTDAAVCRHRGGLPHSAATLRRDGPRPAISSLAVDLNFK